MGLVLISLVFLALGVFVLLSSVNFAWVLWEKERVDNLTKQIKPTEEQDDLFKRKQSREYTQSFDIRSFGKKGVTRAHQAYEKTMVAISDGKYPGWVGRVIDIFNQTRRDFFASVRSFIKYLLHLAKPDEYSDPNTILQENLKEKQVDQAIQQIKTTQSEISKTAVAEVAEDKEEKETDEKDDPMFADDSSPIKVTLNETNPTATIGLTHQKGSSPSNTAFEKLEARILDKLKQSGLTHYNVWLELGELYLKFDEKEKASEVFALVLKNTKDDKEKEIARNRLIGL
jgi:hypothetical protein